MDNWSINRNGLLVLSCLYLEIYQRWHPANSTGFLSIKPLSDHAWGASVIMQMKLFGGSESRMESLWVHQQTAQPWIGGFVLGVPSLSSSEPSVGRPAHMAFFGDRLSMRWSLRWWECSMERMCMVWYSGQCRSNITNFWSDCMKSFPSKLTSNVVHF